MPSRSGCGFLVVVCFFSCVFLLINGSLVFWISPRIATIGDHIGNVMPRFLRFLSGPRIAQIVVFALPILLVFAEWALVDWIVDRISAMEKSAERNDSK